MEFLKIRYLEITRYKIMLTKQLNLDTINLN